MKDCPVMMSWLGTAIQSSIKRNIWKATPVSYTHLIAVCTHDERDFFFIVYLKKQFM